MIFPRLLAAVLVLSMLAAACGETDESNASDATDEPSSQNVIGLDYETFDGDAASLDDFQGAPLVINFFARWCSNCVAEMPDFEAVFQDLGDEVQFVGLSIDQGSREALDLVEQTGITYPIGWDPSEDVYRHFNALAMPTTVFVDENSEIQRVWSGVLSEQALRDQIAEELL